MQQETLNQEPTFAETPSTSEAANIQKRSMDTVPRWALAVCAVLLVLSFAIRQIGLDVTTPLNRIMSAYAVSIEKAAGGSLDPQHHSRQQQTQQQLKHHEQRIKKLESMAHPSAR